MNTLDQLFAKSPLKIYRKKELIFSPKKNQDALYKIIRGYVVVYTLSNDRKKIQAILAPGNIFPIVIHDKEAYMNLYYESLMAVIVKEISQKTFFSQIRSNIAITLEFLELLSQYLVLYINRLENLELENTEKKVINRLVFFAKKFGIKQKSGYKIPTCFTHTLIAESISVSRENVTREITKLKKEKILSSDHGKIFILNLSSLEHRGNE